METPPVTLEELTEAKRKGDHALYRQLTYRLDKWRERKRANDRKEHKRAVWREANKRYQKKIKREKNNP